MFSAEVHTDRRDRLSALLRSSETSGIVLLLGNRESPRNFAHNCYPFRQDSTFLYYIGLHKPDLAVLIDIDEGVTEIFGTDPSVEQIVWTGPRAALSKQARAVGITAVWPVEELSARVEAAAAAGRPIHFLPTYSCDQRERIRRLLASSSLHSEALVRAVVNQRAHKSEQEVSEIEKAADITMAMHRAAAKVLAHGRREMEVAAEVARVALASGGDLAFATIATVRGEILHYGFSERRMKDGQLLLLDIGGEAPSGYAADITRTYPVSGRFTPQQREVYEIVQAAFDTAVGLLSPKRSFLDVHLAACHTIVTGLKDLGLMHGNTEDAVTAGAHALFFPCGTGHMIGLDVHDMENLGEDSVGYDQQKRSDQFGLSSLRLARPLEPSFVVTVEPGIYFNMILAEQWATLGWHRDFVRYDRLAPFKDFGGCRIEDDYLITDSGSRRLGEELPKTAAAIEAMLKKLKE